MASSRLPHISLIGAGKVGSTLTSLLYEHGHPVASIISRSAKPALALAKIVKCKRVSTEVIDIAPETEILIIATPDDAVADIAKGFAKTKLKFKKLFAFHTSGVQTSDVLAPLRRKGASVAAIHPIQSFPDYKTLTQHRNSVRGIFYGIDGEPQPLTKAEQIIKELGGHGVIIPKELKPLYHLACVFTSGYMTVFLNAVNEITKTLQLKAAWTEVFGPLMTSSMENVVKNTASKALTGPIVRRDWSTVKLHLDALATYAPQFLPLYTVSGIEMARVAKEHNKLTQQEFVELVQLFRSSIRSSHAKKSLKRKT